MPLFCPLTLLDYISIFSFPCSSPSREDSEEHDESDSDDSFVNISSPPLTENEETAAMDSLKFPIHILDHRIRIFTQTTVPHDLRRLRTHRENIAQLHKDGNWTKLNSEQINANRTVQVWERSPVYQ